MRCRTGKLTILVVALRSERGYWATEYDASADQLPETLRRQIGRSYDTKKVRNTYPGLLVKDSYWRWPERDLTGNAIDFCVQVLGLSFHDAMRLITGT